MLLLVLLAAAVVVCCGTPDDSNRFEVDPYIVGGDQVPFDMTPYHLALEKEGRYYCGASIISENWALTAAHCVRIGTPNQFYLRSRSYIMLNGGTLHQVVKVVIHEKSTNTSFDYDVAVLRVAIPFNRSAAIRLAKVRPATGTIATVSGWGRIFEDGPTSKSLRWVQVPVVGQTKCEDLNTAADIEITDRMLCAGYTEGGRDACQGDSGGPLVVGDVQIGIVSNGRGCAMPSFGVYTDVAKVRSWIVKKTGV